MDAIGSRSMLGERGRGQIGKSEGVIQFPHDQQATETPHPMGEP